MINRIFLSCGILFTLAACSMSPSIYSDSWSMSVMGVSMDVYIVPDLAEYRGLARMNSNSCTIRIASKATNLIPVYVSVLSHEIYHCLDYFTLDYDHNGFKDEGCQYGNHYCSPTEGYAKFGAEIYMNECGLDYDSLSNLKNGMDGCFVSPRDILPNYFH